MVIFVDLDDAPSSPSDTTATNGTPTGCEREAVTARAPAYETFRDHRDFNTAIDSAKEAFKKPTAQEMMAAMNIGVDENVAPAIRAFACYPIAAEVARHVDLNTMDSLARSCKFIHASLTHYHAALKGSTLVCSKERERAQKAPSPEPLRRYGPAKVNHCARDMVSECRQCGIVVCRNCVVKPPSSTSLKARHRRLCTTCISSPLSTVLNPSFDPQHVNPTLVAASLCTCATAGPWLCKDCGVVTNSSDCIYQRLWNQRIACRQVSPELGGEPRPVVCGKEDKCLAAYEREEMEPVGSFNVAKIVMRIRSGADVYEAPDETEEDTVLEREKFGLVRSWCGWCDRPIPGSAERNELLDRV